MRFALLVVLVACGGSHSPAPTNRVTEGNKDPKTPPEPMASACDTLVVFVDKTGTWIGTPPDQMCFGSHQNGAPDTRWLESELRGLEARLTPSKCTPWVEVAAEDVSYQSVVTVMDVAVKVGFVDTKFADPEHLSMKLPPVMGGLPGPSCAGPLDLASRKKPGTKSSTSSTGELKDAPVVIVTTSELRLGDKTLVDVATATKGVGAIPELEKALKDHPVKGIVILQADASTPATLINRIALTAKAAGSENLLFAVKNK